MTTTFRTGLSLLIGASLLACSSYEVTDAPPGADPAPPADVGATPDAGGQPAAPDGGATADAGSPDAADAAAPTPSPVKVAAFAYANNKLADSYTPVASGSYNSGGGPITATRSAMGVYSIEFGGLVANSGSVQVTAYLSSNVCTVKSWSKQKVNVTCFDNAGAPADSAYLVRVMLEAPAATAGTVAYARADQSGQASYTPDAAFSYNAAGGAITATRSATGMYAVDFGGADFDNGANVQVTTYNSDRHCGVQLKSGSVVHVQCYDPAGAAADSQFMVNVAQVGAGAADVVAHSYAEQAGAASYAPSPSYLFNLSGKGATATRSAPGRYEITFTDLAHTAGNVLVSAYGSDATCAAQGWTGDTFKIDCRDRSGAFVDTRYTVAVTK
jgi:hypothetical protein